jgi:hypothetical protein
MLSQQAPLNRDVLFTLKWVRLSLMLGFALSFSAHSATFNQYLTKESLDFVGSRVLLTSDQRFFFFSRQDTQQRVESLDLQTGLRTTMMILDDDVDPTISRLSEAPNGAVLMLLHTRPDYVLYHSQNGQPFTPLFNEQMTSVGGVINGWYFHQTTAADYVWTDGSKDIQRTLPGTVEPLCAFGADHIIYTQLPGRDRTLMVLHNGESTVLSPDYEFAVLTRIGGVPHTAESCLLRVRHKTSGRLAFLHHQSNGDTTVIDDPLILYILSNGNDYLVVKSAASQLIPSSISLADPVTLSTTHSLEVDTNQLYRLELAGDRATVLVNLGGQTVGPFSMLMLDEQLNVVSTQVVERNTEIITSNDLDHIIFNDRVETYENGQLKHNLPLNSNQERQYFTQPETNQLGFITYDPLRYEFQGSVHILEQWPAIGPALNGPWSDPNYPDQGLSIHHGVRQDGSHYVFTTVYLYQDGAPLWLAGAQDYTPGQSSLSLTLYQYEGGQFLDPQSLPSGTEAGQLTLLFTGCQRLQADFELGQDQWQWMLSKVDDVSYQASCVEVTP